MASGADWQVIQKLGSFTADQALIETYISFADAFLADVEDDYTAAILKKMGELLTAHMLSQSVDKQAVSERIGDIAVQYQMSDETGLRSTIWGSLYLDLLGRRRGGPSLLIS